MKSKKVNYFGNQFIVSAIKFGKSVLKFMIPIIWHIIFFSSIKVAHMTTHSNMIDYEIVHSMRFESKKGKITISTFRLLILNGTKPLGN